MSLIWLNTINGADKRIIEYAQKIEEDWENPVYIEMGSAYGGGVEAIGKRGWTVHGFDTFEGHPTQLADDQKSFEATCMEYWYNDERYGRDKLQYEYQRKELDKQGLTNVILHKGLITPDACENIEEIQMCLIDVDLIRSTKIAYIAIHDKIVKDGYLLMHDTLPENHLPEIYAFVYEKLLHNGEWKLEGEHRNNFLTILQKV